MPSNIPRDNHNLEPLELMDLVAHESRYDGCKWLEGYIVGFERPKNIFDVRNTLVHIWSEYHGEYYFDVQHIDDVILQEKYPITLPDEISQFADFTIQNILVNYSIPSIKNTDKPQESSGIIKKVFIDHDLSTLYLSIFDLSRHTFFYRNIVESAKMRFQILHGFGPYEDGYMNAWVQEEIARNLVLPQHYTLLQEVFNAATFPIVSSEIPLSPQG